MVDTVKVFQSPILSISIATTLKPPTQSYQSHHNHHYLLSTSSNPHRPIKCSLRVHQDVVHVRWAWPSFRSATVHLECLTKRDHRRRRGFCATWTFRPVLWKRYWRPVVADREGVRGSFSDHDRCRCGATSAVAAWSSTIGKHKWLIISKYNQIYYTIKPHNYFQRDLIPTWFPSKQIFKNNFTSLSILYLLPCRKNSLHHAISID